MVEPVPNLPGAEFRQADPGEPLNQISARQPDQILEASGEPNIGVTSLGEHSDHLDLQARSMSFLVAVKPESE